MTARLDSIWRHPIKAVGREALSRVTLEPGETLPGDRVWAIAHEASTANDSEWSRCANFIRAGSSPNLMAVQAQSEGDGLRLTHPDRPPLDVHPETEAEKLIAWVDPLIAEGRARPARVIRAPNGRGMTDTSSPSITLGNLTSHRIIEGRLGRKLSIHRWRCNLWIEGLDPWEEFDMVGRTLRLGGAVFEAYKRIDRCEATAANPETGRRDADLLSLLDIWDHRDFTIGLKVVEGGEIALGDVLIQ